MPQERYESSRKSDGGTRRRRRLYSVLAAASTAAAVATCQRVIHLYIACLQVLRVTSTLLLTQQLLIKTKRITLQLNHSSLNPQFHMQRCRLFTSSIASNINFVTNPAIVDKDKRNYFTIISFLIESSISHAAMLSV